MQFAFNVPNFGPYSDPRLTAELAHEAEESGWDGFFVWDHMQWPWPNQSGKPNPTADPWVLLTLIADRTSRIKFGPIVTPLPRRQPWKVARETVTLDHLSGGRLILGIGLGGGGAEFETAEFANFGLSTDLKVRAEMLDEELAIISSLWSGEEVNFAGQHYQVKNTIFQPPSLQQPRIPIWVAGMWPLKNPARRAARWDGYVPIKMNLAPITPADVRDMVIFFQQERSSDAPFDIIIGSTTPGNDPAKATDIVTPYAEAGCTWWNESIPSWNATAEDVRQRLRQGPPRL